MVDAVLAGRFRGRPHASGARCGAPRRTGCREVPDVSALAAIGTRGTRGYVIYGTAGAFKGQGWLTVGGTSLATPLWAALAALADEQSPATASACCARACTASRGMIRGRSPM